MICSKNFLQLNTSKHLFELNEFSPFNDKFGICIYKISLFNLGFENKQSFMYMNLTADLIIYRPRNPNLLF